MSCTWPGNFIAAVYSTISKMLLTDVIKPIGRWGSRGFEQTPLLASKRFYTYCFKLYILSALPFEGGPLVSLITAVQTVWLQLYNYASLFTMDQRGMRA